MKRSIPNLAIVGIGRWGQNLVKEFRDLEKIGLCKVVLCVSRGNRENLDKLKKNYPTVAHTTYFKQVLNDPKIDAVVLATPPRTHFQLVSQVLKAGKHTFVEKPPAKNLAMTQRLLDLAKQTRKILYIDNIYIFHPLIKKVKKLVEGQKLEFVEFVWLKEGTFDTDIVSNLAYNDLIIASYLIGEPNGVKLKEARGGVTICDYIKFAIDLPKVRECLVSINRISPVKHKQITFKSIKETWIWTNNTLYQVNQPKRELQIVAKLTRDPLSLTCRAFLKSLIRGTSDSESNRLALVAMRLTDSLRAQIAEITAT